MKTLLSSIVAGGFLFAAAAHAEDPGFTQKSDYVNTSLWLATAQSRVSSAANFFYSYSWKSASLRCTYNDEKLPGKTVVSVRTYPGSQGDYLNVSVMPSNGSHGGSFGTSLTPESVEAVLRFVEDDTKLDACFQASLPLRNFCIQAYRNPNSGDFYMLNVFEYSNSSSHNFKLSCQ